MFVVCVVVFLATYSFIFVHVYMFSITLDTLVPVTSVQLGETVTIPCQLPVIETIRTEVHWYKQSAGDTLKVIWTMRESAKPEFAPEFNNSRLKVNHNKPFTNLTILKTNQEDEGIYHCGFTEWRKNTEWTGTYLLVKGNDVLYFHGVCFSRLINCQKHDQKTVNILIQSYFNSF